MASMATPNWSELEEQDSVWGPEIYAELKGPLGPANITWSPPPPPKKEPWPLESLLREPRNITSLDLPWVGSPDSSFEHGKTLPLGGDAANQPWCYSGPPPDSRSPAIGRILKALLRLVRIQSTKHDDTDQWLARIPSVQRPEHISDAKWRAFAIHSRPTVNRVTVHNTFTPSPTMYPLVNPADVNVEELFESLRTPSGEWHPERWVPGIKHPALPPTPEDWKLPAPGEPLPFPWECTLNPFLVHSLSGPAPIFWKIGQCGYLHGGPNGTAVLFRDVDLAQPATRPLLTHMFISGLALADSRLQWRFMIISMGGIRIRHVLEAIENNFQCHISKTEYEKWGLRRRRHAELEWSLRGGAETGDGLRRVDYLGGQSFFRGLAPNPDRSGWMLYLGGQWN